MQKLDGVTYVKECDKLRLNIYMTKYKVDHLERKYVCKPTINSLHQNTLFGQVTVGN